MNPYTVVYTKTWTYGSHQHTSVHYKRVEASDVNAAFDLFEGAAVFVFPGHIVAVGDEE